MKKLIVSLALSLLISSAFARTFFGPRVFEMRVNSDISVSNTGLAMQDSLVKKLVLDLKKMADDIPDSGWNFNTIDDINLGFNLNLDRLFVGLKFGTQAFGNIDISKDFFDSIAKGTKPSETINVTADGFGDAFAYMETTVKFKVQKYGITIKPAFFVPVAHAVVKDSGAKICNKDDGSLIVDMDTDIDLYTAFGKNGISDFNIIETLGFDLAGEFEWPILPKLTLTGKARIPIVPGRLSYKKDIDINYHYETKFQSMMNGESATSEYNSKSGDYTQTSFSINRPMKFAIFADFLPAGKFITFTGGLGIGFLHPFTSDPDTFKAFPEYYIGANMNLFNVFNLTLSTEYTDLLFQHMISVGLNLRVIEIDTGIAMASQNFEKSFACSGTRGFVTFCIGF